MVTRVDRKPVIYGAGLVRFLRPALQVSDKKLIKRLLELSQGHAIPQIEYYQLMDVFEDVELDEYWTKMDMTFTLWDSANMDEEEMEIVRIARAAYVSYRSRRTESRAIGLSEVVVKCYREMLPSCTAIYYGPEATYLLMNHIINGTFFDPDVTSKNIEWSVQSAVSAMKLQGPYMMTHASASGAMALMCKRSITPVTKHAWDVFKKTETLAIRLSSRRSVQAHAYHSGILRRSFDPADNLLDDFEIPLTGYAAAKDRDRSRMYIINGLRCVMHEGTLFVLTRDDCVSLSLIAQCWFRNTLYFSEANGYPTNSQVLAQGAAHAIYTHICRRIGMSKNFADTIRSIHICAQKEFNDLYEEEKGDDLGWKERSENYTSEAIALDPMGPTLYEKCASLAVSKVDRLNVGMMYHMFVGDDMLITDLRSKVSKMSDKVRSADKVEWASFLKFSKSYLLARYMFSTKRKPRVGGDVAMLNDAWASRCISGKFSMPNRDDWGKVWIEGEYPWTNHADTWHLDAQDVSYVLKDLDAMKAGRYTDSGNSASELLMAMQHGEVLDPLVGSTPKDARERISGGEATHVAVLTTAPKAENAKPSWKKRVTFAADNEFRKMQAEYDRNARRAMFFIRGPSLGMDQTVLETQFRDIAISSSVATAGAICSHDISAWSESMDRGRKFEFEQILINMTTRGEMTNISRDWEKIHAVINKQGCRESYPITQGSFQGFDGSASTILHSMILLYCLDTARHSAIINKSVKANLATLIDDCVALMNGLTDKDESTKFWAHLKVTYDRLGFEVDDLKSIFSTIKAIYLSRRFILGGEVPADYKVFIKAHVSYEDPLRSVTDVPKDIFGALRGACDANGQAWFIYFCAFVTSLMEASHQVDEIMKLPYGAVAVAAIAPHDEMGWGYPSMIDWSTNDVIDKRNHFNAIIESACDFDSAPLEFRVGTSSMDVNGRRMFEAIKAQPWRRVSVSSLFTNPFEAVREGPMKPDMLKRNAVGDILQDIVKAEPWKSLLGWNTSETTTLVRDLLASSGFLHAPTLAALVNCMPDNYRLGMIGKAVGSNSVLDMLPRGMKSVLKRRVHKVGVAYVTHMFSILKSQTGSPSPEDISVISHCDRTILEREAFYNLNGVQMVDHTFPDPVATFTNVYTSVGSKICPSRAGLRKWDNTLEGEVKVSELLSNKGIYVPRKSARVWEVTTEYGKGWDSVSQKVALGLAVLARSKADGHGIDGLYYYFMFAWNEAANVKVEDANLIAIQGNIKRLDSNPGSSTHPITVHRNISTGFMVDLTTAVNAIKTVSVSKTGCDSNLHDPHSHFTAMRAVCAWIYECQFMLGNDGIKLEYLIGLRREAVIASSTQLMTTDRVANRIQMEILDSATPYGLVQACPALAHVIVIPTMHMSWVKMINALFSADYTAANQMLDHARSLDLPALISELQSTKGELSAAIVRANIPITRHSIVLDKKRIVAFRDDQPSSSTKGDTYTLGVGRASSKAGKLFSVDRPSEITAAVVIKSALWSRLKKYKMSELASLVYGDPDASWNIVKSLNTEKMWKTIISECTRNKLRGIFTEVIMKAFYILGVHGLHLRDGSDVDMMAHSITSYFGASLSELIKICAEDICSIAGRVEKNFARPTVEMVITHKPTVMDAKLRADHLNNLKKYNIENLTERLKAIDDGNIKHTGDKRVCSGDDDKEARENTKARRVFLQVRRMVYKALIIPQAGDIEVDAEEVARMIQKSAFTTIKRRWEFVKEDPIKARLALAAFKEMDIDIDSDESILSYLKVPENDLRIERLVEYMEDIMPAVACVGGYWNPSEGEAGLKYSVQQAFDDAAVATDQKFAISAAEIAPKVYRYLMTSGTTTEDIYSKAISEVASEASGVDESDWLDPFAPDYHEKFLAAIYAPSMAAWKQLAVCVICGKIDGPEVDAILGTELGMIPTKAKVKAACLYEFDEQDLRGAFPNLDAEYQLCGVAFNEEWLDEDDDEGYTVDEAHRGLRAGLF